MRIQHNIMAMNAYRNYNTNTSALSKNLEKLSSGYKINRAGDDAAGLAISEKMRAQITGLNAAQKNVKDGISLVKTAEGAMQEIQDMLNRMDYLATQSANGTYQDEVDREALQKEVNQLKDEINRIADSANFNGIKLLDGSLDTKNTAATDAKAAADAAQAAADAAQAAVESAKGDTVFGEEAKLPIHTTMATNNTPSTSGAAETVLETDYKPSGDPGFSVTFNGMSHVFADPAATGKTTPGEYVSIKVNDGAGDTEIKLQEADLAAIYKEVTGEDAKKGDTATAEMIAKAAEKYIKDTGAKVGGTGQTAGEFEVTGGNKFTAKADGDKLVFSIKGDPATELGKVPNFTVAFQGLDEAKVDAEGNKFTTGAVSQTGTNGSKDTVITVKYKDADGNEQTKEITFQSGANAGATNTALATAINNDTDLKQLFKATAGAAAADGTAIEAKELDSKAAVTGIEVKTAGDDDVAIVAGEAVEAHGAYKTGTFGYTNSGTPVTIQTGTPQIDQLASTVITLDNTKVVDGATVRFGDQTYTFAIGEDSKYKDVENAIYVDLADTDYTKAADGTITLKAGAGEGLDKYLDKLTEVAANNKTFSVGYRAGTGGQIGLKQLAEAKDSTDMSTKEKLQSYIGITSVDDEATAASTAAAKAEAQAKADELQKTADELKAAAEKAFDGKPLQLQIGDTADSFNQLKVSVGDMHTKALGIADLDISTAEKAAGAIDTIKSAINNVSSVRGDLGAYQNRLEHTANNLSVMAENIQDAESTIRDTDVAEEMMAYTKNNILIQSAQAMLAQANAVPQGVLQLLG